MVMVWENGQAIEKTEAEAQIFTPTPQELEAEVQALADDISVNEERLMALAMASVDLRMTDITGLTTQQVRAAFRDRVVFYLRQNRGL